ncbi:MFS transporter [Methylobacterium sp. WL30]|jgi:MFS family permease|uniref:MFS transporter n=1 Tax=unclassified Methylobacterium TaxID=2615210 RepID=UPI0011C98B66|nr:MULTISPECIES: MFS transporter [unclassified Methylobacterium]MCJ2010221.1 MFS transporter [Methylobacterium sp. J-092]MCJ2038301.1 MFS transporter [Methylobacterium sp. J-059]TXM90725.1 MFS transporter [Methylobacterium sp. WL116]TXN26730.1 MFS transporter [Methylobacterium sp. WL93]TXN47126.1 MFS transporter [Methylobacterium sp. WL119]
MPSAKTLRGLDALNFFLADVRDGLGPYLAIYLIAVRGPDQGWNEATTGLIMTIAGIAGLIAQTPAGMLIDGTNAKRAVVIAAALAVTASCLALPFIGNFYLVAATQSVAGVAGAIFPPALAAITLGIVGPKMFSRRIGRNEGFNHAGNAVSAALAGGLAYFFGPVVVFWLMGALAVCSIGAMLLVPARAIDDDLARGMTKEQDVAEEDAPSGFATLLKNKPLVLFAGLCALFHLSNAAMLTSVGQLLTHLSGKDHATSLIAVCIVAAQCVMVPVAMFVGAKADAIGRKPIFLAAFGVLALRGVLYTLSDNPFWLVGVQLLDGVGAGVYGALFPVVVADLTRGGGRFNAAQGAVATAQGLGAAFSATFAGLIIVSAGYSAAFLALAATAGLGFVLYLALMPETRDATAIGGRPDGGLPAAMPATA